MSACQNKPFAVVFISKEKNQMTYSYEPELDERLRDIIYELSTICYAMLARPGIEVSEQVMSGFYIILDRQIQSIETVIKELDEAPDGAGR